MKLRNLINKSYYCSIGHIGNKDDLELHERYILYNLPVLNEFKQHIIVVNYSGPYQKQNTELWKKYFPNCILLDLDHNRGHSFGIADQENAIIDYCQAHNITWICKTSHDVVFNQDILSSEIEDGGDFYYMNGIGYGGMEKYDFDIDRTIREDFYPQTNFYFIDVTKVDYLYDKTYIDETYNYIQTLKNYNGKVWHYIKGWTCEDFLKKCVERNNLTKYHLVPEEKYRILLEMVAKLGQTDSNMHDSSHKNIMINGVCHFHYPNEPVRII